MIGYGHGKYQIDGLSIGSAEFNCRLKAQQYAAIRCDNGPEYTSHELINWAEDNGIKLNFIQPGNPQQNAYIERYNRTVRYDWLGQYLFCSLDELQRYATEWQWFYNHERPNMALGGYTPRQHELRTA